MKQDKELLALLESPVDVKRLIRKLAFNMDALESAAQNQPRLRLEAGRLKAQVALEQSTLKRRLSRIIGKKSIRARRHGEKVTEGAVKNALSLDEEVQDAQKKFDKSEAIDVIVNQLLEAYKDRSMMISVLTRLQASEISSRLAAVKGDEEVRELHKRARKIQKEWEDL
jgi:hypothetical protein